MDPEIFPMGDLPFPFKYFWAMAIVVNLINIFIGWQRLPEKVRKDEVLRARYAALNGWIAFWTSLPWALMGAIILAGKAQHIFQFFYPAMERPWILVWWGAMGGLDLAATYWIFSGGAETLSKYPGLFMVPQGEPRKIKILWSLGLLGQAVGATIFFFMDPFHQGGPSMGQGKDLFPILFPFFFIGMWFITNWSLAQMGGWAGLAKVYLAEEKPDGTSLRANYVRLGQVGYGGVVTLLPAARGLHLSVMFISRFAHPPLFIPWGEITGVETKGFFGNSAELEFKGAPGVILRVPMSLISKIQDACGGMLKLRTIPKG